MRELLYTVLELEKEYKNRNCEFCSNRRIKTNKAVKEIVTRHEATDELIAVDVICEECEEKYWNNQIPKCNRCGRLQTELDFDYFSRKNVCYCIRNNEKLEEKELPSLPHERESMTTFYERQINGLREELNTAEVEIDTHLEALEISEDWHKRQKQELLDRIKELEAENKQLKEQNNKITPQELVSEIESHKKEIADLKEQVEQLTKQQNTQIEVPPKESKIKNLFKFGGKK